MTKIENKAQYDWAVNRVEELLPLVDDNTPKDDKNLIELELLSSLVADYSEEHFAVGTASLADVMKLRMYEMHLTQRSLAAMLGIDFVIAIGSKAARIADGAAMSGGDVVHFATKEEALPTVREQLRPNTSMLIKASHSMRFERLTEDLRKYYD